MLAIPAALVGVVTIAQTHEVFHQRPVWLVLAVLEGCWWRTQGAALAAPVLARLPRTALPAGAP
jgi:hypothetical protein